MNWKKLLSFRNPPTKVLGISKDYDPYVHWEGQPVPPTGMFTVPPNYTVVNGKFHKIGGK